MWPLEKRSFHNDNISDTAFDFEGTGFILRGEAKKIKDASQQPVIQAELYIDDIKTETARLPTDFTTRRYELFWKYGLPNAKHHVRIKVIKPGDEAELTAWEYIVYTDRPLSK